MKETLHLIHAKQMPIFEQLQIEEALLRTDTKNVCFINEGSPKAIVMGISGDPEKLLHLESVRQAQIPIIKRFSGGGTVIVDEKTLFVSFIFNKDTVAVPSFPEPLLRWSAELYQKSWNISNFSLQAQDYTIGQKKCGGNAQYIRKDRWLHHSSFLWDYSEKNMNYLKLPPKRPEYRLDRPHTDFLCKLKDYAPSIEGLIYLLKEELSRRFSLETLFSTSLHFHPHRQSTHFL